MVSNSTIIVGAVGLYYKHKSRLNYINDHFEISFNNWYGNVLLWSPRKERIETNNDQNKQYKHKTSDMIYYVF